MRGQAEQGLRTSNVKTGTIYQEAAWGIFLSYFGKVVVLWGLINWIGFFLKILL